MKILITERQYNILLEQKEEPKVYTDKKKYEIALKKYNRQLGYYNFSLNTKKYLGKYDINYQTKWWELINSEPYVKTYINYVLEKLSGWEAR